MNHPFALLLLAFALIPAAHADEEADLDPYAQAHLQNLEQTRQAEEHERRLQEEAAAREAAITPEMRAAIIEQAKREALEQMREEQRLEEKFQRSERMRMLERRSPVRALLCQGDYDCMED